MSKDETAVTEVQDTSTTDSAPVEDDFSEGLDAFDSAEDLDTEGDDDAADETESLDDNTSKEKPEEESQDDTKDPSTDWEKLNGKSQDRFRQIANENRELKRQHEELLARQAQFATEQQLLDQVDPDTGDYYTTDKVARIAHYQRLETQQAQAQQETYQTQVRMSQNQLLQDGERALQEFPMFDDESKDYDPELAAIVDPILLKNLITDPDSGEVVGMRVSPYELLKTYHDALSRNSQREQTIGRAEAQRATEKMLANVDHAGGATGHKTEEKDPILDGFDSPY